MIVLRNKAGLFAGCALLVTAIGVQSAPVAGQTSLPWAEAPGPMRFAEAIDRGRTLSEALMVNAATPGLSVAVAVNGDVVWSEGFGYADVENRVAVTPLTKFRIGSVSKTLTSMAIGQLYEHGQLDLDAKVQRYVPYFPEKQWPVTVRLVGGHIGGIRTYNYADYDEEKDEFLSAKRYRTVRDAIGVFKDDPLVHQPGTKYLYSSNGFNLLSAVIEGASGESYLDYMHKHVFEPLGLRQTVADHPDSIISYRTRFYRRAEDGRLLNGRYADLSNKWAGGGFLSTPTDLVRWGSALLKPGFLKRETLEVLWKSQRTTDGKETGYGIGWMSGTDFDGRRTVSHGGGSVGGTTYFLVYPDDGVVIAMTVNASVSPMSEKTAQTIAEGFLPSKQMLAKAASSAAPPDLAGTYRYTVTPTSGKPVEGTLQIMGAPGSYRGVITPDVTRKELRRSQDGSYSLALTQDIPISVLAVNGSDARIIGTDPSGFTNVWISFDGSGFTGKWDGRGVTGSVRGVKRISASSAATSGS